MGPDGNGRFSGSVWGAQKSSLLRVSGSLELKTCAAEEEEEETPGRMEDAWPIAQG